MPLMQTSPSPCAAWASPAEKSAPGFSTGRYSVAPLQSSRTSMLPPKMPGGRVRNSPSSAGATPITPQKGRSGTMAGASERLTSRFKLPEEEIRLGEALLQKAESFDHARPAPAFVRDFENVDLQHVAGLGALNEDRAGERVDAAAIDGQVFGQRHAADGPARRSNRGTRSERCRRERW